MPQKSCGARSFTSMMPSSARSSSMELTWPCWRMVATCESFGRTPRLGIFHVHRHMHIYIYIHIYIHTYIYIYVCVCISKHVYLHSSSCIHTYIYINAYTIYIYIYIYIYIPRVIRGCRPHLGFSYEGRCRDNSSNNMLT